jgi:hypothetical protein
VFTGATTSADGAAGLVKQPLTSDKDKFLRGDGTWTTIDLTLLGAQALGSYAAADHTHNYAGSSSAGGAATRANKINTDAGSATQPVYFDNGIPVATTYSLAKSVPADAVFTDTNDAVTNTLGTTTKAYVTGTTTATTNTGGLTFDTGVYLDTTAGHLTATQFNGALNGKANTAGKLHSAVNITVGSKTNAFDGSAAISFSLSDIGAVDVANVIDAPTSNEISTTINEIWGTTA